ncbi:MAG TPA: c-type cytochrome [Burkholderiaceae bacterium]|nr:c-type cytochrome [Burkholderiaceae bacterium]
MKLLSLLLSALAVVVAQPAATQERKSAAASSQSDAEVPVSMCIGCHSIPGYQASFPYVFRVPKIGGQNQQYLEAALKAYRQGQRNHPSMMAVAKGLTDQQIAAVAAYYAARGDTAVVAVAK